MRTTVVSSITYRFLAALVLTALVLAAVPASPARAATINVNTFFDQLDGNPGNGQCSLREAIANANNNGNAQKDCAAGTGDDTIVLPAGTYTLTDAGGQLDLDISDTSSLTIQGSGGMAIIDGSGQTDKVFDIASAAGNFTLNNVTVRNGNTTGAGAGINYGSTSGTLTVMNSVITNNTASGTGNCGAGIYNNTAATVVITNSTIQNNSCTDVTGDGGGLFKGTGGTLTITGSTFYNNTAADNGGGIQLAAGTATITNSTFASNVATTRGGAIQMNGGTLTIEFSTFSGNTANGGASSGGALQISGGTASIVRSILANSTAGLDCDKSLTGAPSFTNSLVTSVGNCGAGGGFITSNPNLGALQNNGGPTQTMALGGTSPALNAASSCGAVTTDQRGAPRPQGAACDLGAFELDNVPPMVVSVTRLDPNPNGSNTVRYSVVFSEPVTGAGGTTTDFSLTTTGLTNASVASISGSGTTYTVTVNTGTGNGTLRLNVEDDDSIIDAAGNPLGGPGVGNGKFTGGQVYDIQRVVPGATTPGAPSGSIGSNYNPTFNWSAVSTATWYYLYLNGPTGNKIYDVWYDASVVCSGSNCSATPPTTLGGGSHTWWVRTWSPAGYGPWSSAQTFSTTIPPLPGAATPVSPNAPVNNNMPTYTWNTASNATWYQLWVNGPSGNVINAWYSATTNCSGGTCSAIPSTALGAGNHTFWVRTWNASGYGPWSSPMNFSFNLPAAATLVSPSGNTPSANPTYTWNKVPGASWYYLWVSGPSGAVVTEWFDASLVCGASTCSATPATSLGSGAHTFWVRTWNQLGYGPWSSPMNFTRP